MKKGLLSVALILTIVLTLAFFTGEKAGAYYGGTYGEYSTYSASYGGNGGTYDSYGTYGNLYNGFSNYGDSYSGISTYGSSYGGYGTYGDFYSGFSGYGDFYGGYSISGGTYGDSYSGFSGYGGFYGPMTAYGSCYGAWRPGGTLGGSIFVPEKVNEPSPPESQKSENLPTGSNSTQKTQWPGSANIWPTIIPTPGTVPINYPPINYPVFPTGSEWSWPAFPTVPSSPTIFPLPPVYLPDADWPIVYPTLPPNFFDNISIPW